MCNAARLDESRLTEIGDRIVLIELQGFLFFGKTEQIVRSVREMPDLVGRVEVLVVDFHRVTGMDSSAGASFDRLIRFTDDCGIDVVFCGASPDVLTVIQLTVGRSSIRYEIDQDHALEQCEELLLASVRSDEVGEPSAPDLMEWIDVPSASLPAGVGHRHRGGKRSRDLLPRVGPRPRYARHRRSGRAPPRRSPAWIGHRRAQPPHRSAGDGNGGLRHGLRRAPHDEGLARRPCRQRPGEGARAAPHDRETSRREARRGQPDNSLAGIGTHTVLADSRPVELLAGTRPTRNLVIGELSHLGHHGVRPELKAVRLLTLQTELAGTEHLPRAVHGYGSEESGDLPIECPAGGKEHRSLADSSHRVGDLNLPLTGENLRECRLLGHGRGCSCSGRFLFEAPPFLGFSGCIRPGLFLGT